MPAVALTVETATKPASCIEARAVEQLALADRSASRPRSAAAAAPKQGGRALWKKRDFVRRVNLSGID